MTTTSLEATPLMRSGGTCNSYLVRTVNRHLSAVYDRALAPVELRTTQFSLLRALVLDGPRTLSVVAADLGMDRTTLSSNIKPLERAGLIAVTAGEDRRSRTIAITARGHERLERAMPLWIEAQRSFEAALGHPDARELRALLKRTLAWGGSTEEAGPGAAEA